VKIMNKIMVLGIIILIGFIVNSCEDQKEEPVPQSYPVNGITTMTGTVNVTINYLALPGTTPGYLSLLETACEIVLPYAFGTGNLTIDVIAGDSGFPKIDSKILSIGASWFKGKTQDDIIDAMGSIVDAWVSMNKKDQIIEISDMLSFELAQVKRIGYFFV